WLQSNPAIAFFEPNFVVTTAQFPNDDRFSELWGLNNTGQTGGTFDADIDAPEAWDISTGSAEIVVGVIDTGVDYTHPDLAGNIWTNPGEVPDNGLDDDSNGFIDDVHGYDFVGNDGDPMDGNSHGTHVSGTIAAMGNNGVGVVGVNWSASIMALQFLDAGGFGDTADAVRAVNYATMMRTTYGVNIRLTSNSWGGGGFSQALFDAIEASGFAGMLFVAAAGNDGLNNDQSPHYPSNYALDNVIAVAATDHNDNLATFSNYGATSVDLAAPGVAVYSTVPGGGYEAFSGTSMATPHVAGVMALAWSVSPTATKEQIRDAVLAGVDPVASVDGLTVTGGRLNARGTLDRLGLSVANSDPAVGEVVTFQPTDFTLNFTNAYDFSTVQAGDLRVNKAPANTFSVIDSNTVVFHFNVSPVTTDGPQTMEIDAGSILRAGDGNPIPAWFSTFYYDSLRMAVLSTSPVEGEILNAAPGAIILDFNEAFDPTSVDAADLILSHGAVTAAVVLDSDSVSYTISYATVVKEAAVTYSLKNGAILDLHGTPSPAYTGGFFIDDPLINRYESTDVPVSIPDLTTVTSTIIIETSQIIADLDVELTITHTWDEDLDVFLIAPDGTRVQLFTDVGGGDDDFIGTVLDDEAATSIADGSAPFTGRFRPGGRLYSFDRMDALGTWTLEITDDEAPDPGTLLNWALIIDSGEVSASPTIIDDGDPGFEITGEWLGFPFGFQGDAVFNFLDDNAVATWTFSVAEAGQYRIAATWVGDEALSPMAPFTVIDGTTPLATVRVDQTQFPNDFTEAEVLWEELGVFNIAGATLTVRLTVPASGALVMADAIRIERVGDLPTIARFESTDVPLAIPDLSIVTSTLVVTAPLVIEDIDVELTITHTYDSDLDVFLIAPNGTRVELFSDVGGNGDGFTGTILDDEANTSIAAGNAPFTGRFKPEGSLSVLDGLNPAGTWRLEITDDAGVDTGSLVSWAIVITSNADVALPEIIDNNEPGFELTGDWLPGGGPGVGRNDNVHMAFGESQLPTDVATWTFDLGSPGRYRVSATWFTNLQYSYLFSDRARFEVFDPDMNMVRGTAIVNQQVFPTGFDDAGSTWQDLGVFEIFGSTLQVRLFSSGDDQTYVVADAIRIEKLANLPSAAEIQVTEGGFDIADNTGAVDFGSANFNAPVQRTFTISNSGMQPLMLTGGVTVTGPMFTVIAQPAVGALNPGESTTFTVEMQATTPGSHSAAITILSNDVDENPFEFAITGTVLATQIVDDGDPGYFQTGDFQSAPLSIARGGDNSYAYFQAAPSEASWTFSVTPGQYVLSATWFNTTGSGDLFASNAPFSIFDGAQLEGAFSLDQRNAPSDFFADGSWWENIGGGFVIDSTTLTVRLTNVGASGYVLADAIRLVWVGPADSSALQANAPALSDPTPEDALRGQETRAQLRTEAETSTGQVEDAALATDYWNDELDEVAVALAKDQVANEEGESAVELAAVGESSQSEVIDLALTDWI
ncbi:MAG: S8 family serine peptidase, partial [Planctomycetes bacterium]|nr:S8 family serine peptidase [Planctomycetota bacterium]